MNKEIIKTSYEMLKGHFTERLTRLRCATESLKLGRGGITLVSKATGVSRQTIHNGIKELNGEKEIESTRVRKEGGGRKKKEVKEPLLITELENLVSPLTRGDPENPLKWICKSTRKIAETLKSKGIIISFKSVYTYLKNMGYTLQSNKKTKEGSNHEDRDAQFNYINEKSKEFLTSKNPVISVDTKKKELVGNFKNNGREFFPKGNPLEVNGHDFPDEKLGKASPYGIYDILENIGWVNVGISSDTAEFAVNGIRTWWNKIGKKMYSKATKIYVNADGGGSNGYRVRLWKTELQKLANEIGKEIHVSHFPPGTSKWNKIEHKMFSFISHNWRGKPLLDYATIINLINNTTTTKGLKIEAMLDEKIYEKGIKISDEELAKVNIFKDAFHGEWNYVIIPTINV